MAVQQIQRTMLHRNVMVVAKERPEGWRAYCFPVPGRNHDEEECLWETEGVKLREDLARILFPDFEGEYV